MFFSKHSLAAADYGVGQRESVLLRVGEPHAPDPQAGKLSVEGRGKDTALGVSETQRQHYGASEAEKGFKKGCPRMEQCQL